MMCPYYSDYGGRSAVRLRRSYFAVDQPTDLTTKWLGMSTRYGSPEPGSGMAPVGCGSLATGGTGGGEVGRATPRPRLCCERRRLFDPAGSSGLFPDLRETEKAAEQFRAR
jgi:hypothetical protein